MKFRRAAVWQSSSHRPLPAKPSSGFGRTPRRTGSLFLTGDPADYPALLEGRSVTSTVSLAGQVELALEQMRLLFGDGVNLRMLSPGERRPAKHQLLVEFSDGFGFYGTVSMYGGLWAFREGENDNPYYLAAKEKPSPLTAAFDADYFAGIWQVAKPTLSVKALARGRTAHSGPWERGFTGYPVRGAAQPAKPCRRAR